MTIVSVRIILMPRTLRPGTWLVRFLVEQMQISRTVLHVRILQSPVKVGGRWRIGVKASQPDEREEAAGGVSWKPSGIIVPNRKPSLIPVCKEAASGPFWVTNATSRLPQQGLMKIDSTIGLHCSRDFSNVRRPGLFRIQSSSGSSPMQPQLAHLVDLDSRRRLENCGSDLSSEEGCSG